jgi:DNA polymerase-3 subunit delta
VTKLAASRIDAFLKAPDRAIRAALIYGPDAGRVRERAAILARAICDDPQDAFRVAELAPAALGDDPDLLAAEVGQISMFGGQRLIRLREAGDSLGSLFQRFFKAAVPGDGFVLVEGGDLSARSALRRAFEGAADAVAIACYADNARDLHALVREIMSARRIHIDDEASAYLVNHLGGDRALSRRELEKLALYAGDGGAIALGDAQASVGDTAAMEMDDAVLAAADGDFAMLERTLDRLFAEGESPVSVLRAAQRHVTRLHLAAVRIDAGGDEDEAVRGLRPPVFFKTADRIKAQLRYWPARRARAALTLLFDAEINLKRAGPPPDAVCRDALLRIARRVAEARRATAFQPS